MLQNRSDSPSLGAIRFVEAVQFTLDELLPRFAVTNKFVSIALHPTCFSTRLGLNPALVALASAIAEKAYVPDDWGCCAFAGDRGMLHPELTVSATEREASEVNGREFVVYASLNRACELGMSRATGHPYIHILELVETATRP